MTAHLHTVAGSLGDGVRLDISETCEHGGHYRDPEAPCHQEVTPKLQRPSLFSVATSMCVQLVLMCQCLDDGHFEGNLFCGVVICMSIERRGARKRSNGRVSWSTISSLLVFSRLVRYAWHTVIVARRTMCVHDSGHRPGNSRRCGFSLVQGERPSFARSSPSSRCARLP